MFTLNEMKMIYDLASVHAEARDGEREGSIAHDVARKAAEYLNSDSATAFLAALECLREGHRNVCGSLDPHADDTFYADGLWRMNALVGVEWDEPAPKIPAVRP